MTRESYVTLAMDDEYCIGALVLGVSIRQTQTAKELTVLVTPGVSKQMRPLLYETFDNVVDVQPIKNLSPDGGGNLLRSELQATFTKIHCWKLLQFEKCVFLDADTIVLHNIDELFQHNELSAVPDPSWPDYFNPGVFTLHPNKETFDALLELATVSGSPDGTDQTLLNHYFVDWCTAGIHSRLSYVYNCLCRISEATSFDFYTSAPAWVKFGCTIRVGHFTGPIKPWHRASMARHYSQLACTSLLETAGHSRAITRVSGMLAYWWSMFLVLVRPRLAPDMYLGDFRPFSEDQTVVVVTQGSGDQTPPAPYCPSFTQHFDHQPSAATDQPATPTACVAYHPEFHEQQWHSLHQGQRTDQENRFVEQHYSYQPPSPPPLSHTGIRSDHHKLYQATAPPPVEPALPLTPTWESVAPSAGQEPSPPASQEPSPPVEGQKESPMEEPATVRLPIPEEKPVKKQEEMKPVPPPPPPPSETRVSSVVPVQDQQQPVAQEQEQCYLPTCDKCHVERELNSLDVAPPAVAVTVNDAGVLDVAKPTTGGKNRSQRRKRRRSKPVAKHTKLNQTGISGELQSLKFTDRLCFRHERTESEHMYAWERGEIDYTGVDRFEHILKRLTQTLRRVGGAQNLPTSIDII